MMKRYIRNRETISGRLEEELVMMDLQKGKYFSLNPVASRIWELLEHEQDVGALCASLQDEFNVDATQCRSEVEAFLNDLQRHGLVLVINS